MGRERGNKRELRAITASQARRCPTWGARTFASSLRRICHRSRRISRVFRIDSRSAGTGVPFGAPSKHRPSRRQLTPTECRGSTQRLTVQPMGRAGVHDARFRRLRCRGFGVRHPANYARSRAPHRPRRVRTLDRSFTVRFPRPARVLSEWVKHRRSAVLGATRKFALRQRVKQHMNLLRDKPRSVCSVTNPGHCTCDHAATGTRCHRRAEAHRREIGSAQPAPRDLAVGPRGGTICSPAPRRR